MRVTTGVALIFALALLEGCSGGGSSRSFATFEPGASARRSPRPSPPTTPTAPPLVVAAPPVPPGAPLETVISGDAPVPYNLSDRYLSRLDVTAEYSLDGGATFLPATQGVGGDGTTNLTAGTDNTYDAHTFAWATLADVGGRFAPKAILRIRPRGHPSVDHVFNVDDRPPRMSPALLYGPFLQATTATSVKVVWATRSPSDGAVAFGKGALATTVASGTATKHVVRLTGLTPATTYSYCVLVGGQPATPLLTFNTAPGPQASFTALVVGDSGSGTQSQFDLAARMSTHTFDLMVHTGDVIYPNGAEGLYPSRFFLPYGRLLTTHPIFPTIGMHDQEDGSFGAGYSHVFEMDANNAAGSKHYYSFVWGNTKFISIDTETVFVKPGPHDVWLEQELASSTSRWLVVVMHAGLYSSGPHGDSPVLQARLQPLFEKYRVHLLLSGHDHLYSRGGPIVDSNADPGSRGFYYIVTAGGGAEPYRVLNPHATDAANLTGFHFVLLEFGADAIQGRMVRIDGSTGDSFSIQHP